MIAKIISFFAKIMSFFAKIMSFFAKIMSPTGGKSYNAGINILINSRANNVGAINMYAGVDEQERHVLPAPAHKVVEELLRGEFIVVALDESGLVVVAHITGPQSRIVTEEYHILYDNGLLERQGEYRYVLSQKGRTFMFLPPAK